MINSEMKVAIEELLILEPSTILRPENMFQGDVLEGCVEAFKSINKLLFSTKSDSIIESDLIILLNYFCFLKILFAHFLNQNDYRAFAKLVLQLLYF